MLFGGFRQGEESGDVYKLAGEEEADPTYDMAETDTDKEPTYDFGLFCICVRECAHVVVLWCLCLFSGSELVRF